MNILDLVADVPASQREPKHCFQSENQADQIQLSFHTLRTSTQTYFRPESGRPFVDLACLLLLLLFFIVAHSALFMFYF